MNLPETSRREAKAIGIGERRVTSSWLTDDRWDNKDRERGISVSSLMMLAINGKVTETWRPIAAISLHALARWFERSSMRSQFDLLCALATLIETDEEAERVYTPGGFWLGGVIPVLDSRVKGVCRMRNVRTFVS